MSHDDPPIPPSGSPLWKQPHTDAIRHVNLTLHDISALSAWSALRDAIFNAHRAIVHEERPDYQLKLEEDVRILTWLQQRIEEARRAG